MRYVNLAMRLRELADLYPPTQNGTMREAADALDSLVDCDDAAERLVVECKRVGVLAGSVPWDIGAALDAYDKATDQHSSEPK